MKGAWMKSKGGTLPSWRELVVHVYHEFVQSTCPHRFSLERTDEKFWKSNRMKVHEKSFKSSPRKKSHQPRLL